VAARLLHLSILTRTSGEVSPRTKYLTAEELMQPYSVPITIASKSGMLVNSDLGRGARDLNAGPHGPES
jgi:hypothetical protein